MRRIAPILVGIVLLVGCQQNYTGKCTVEKVDGKVTQVNVTMPPRSTVCIKDRDEMDRLINALESLVLDLKAAREQMPVVEPPPKK